jgi:hypothetical protein
MLLEHSAKVNMPGQLPFLADLRLTFPRFVI